MRLRPRANHRWLIGSIILALLIVAASQLDWSALESRFSSTAPTPALSTSGAGIHGVFIEPQDGVSPVIDEIDAATRSVDVQVYLLTSDEIIAALKRAKGRGAGVRVIIERQPYKSEQDKSITRSQLETKGFQVRFGPSRYTYTHSKFIIVDRKIGVILTANFTHAAFTGNRDLGVTTTVPSEVTDLQAVFDADWRDEPTPVVTSLVLSPTNSRDKMSGLIASAKSRIDVYAEEMFDDRFVDAFVSAQKRGVTVRILIPSSDDPDQAALVSQLKAADVDVRLLDNPKLHAKMMLIDGQRVFVGSQNMSANSIDHNREVGLILSEPANVVRLGKAFQRDFVTAQSAVQLN